MDLALNDRIRAFYDRSSSLWENVWGEHMHHGYYPPAGSPRTPREAQADLIDALLGFGGVTRASRILDVGCGIGGSSLVLAERFNAQVTGITLSPVQAARARARAEARGYGTSGPDARATFRVEDALHMPFAEGAFDLVWSLESAEHIPDKRALLAQCRRVLAPGGTLLLATWCRRSTEGERGELGGSDRRLLEKICNAYALPPFVSPEVFESSARALGFRDIRTDDWSDAVSPFWSDVILSALRPGSLVGLVAAGWSTVQAAWAMRWMREGFRRGLLRYALLRATR
ncbi:MAG TPA: methyltransferase domain-containing protein [Myxococcaceae bacterium]|nr:methyltransferase domain-containing protein [Myxococcaceae bacterium]